MVKGLEIKEIPRDTREEEERAALEDMDSSILKIDKERRLIKARRELEEEKGLRDKPDALATQEEALRLREEAVTAREDVASGREERLLEMQEELSSRQSIGNARLQRIEKDFIDRKAKWEEVMSEAKAKLLLAVETFNLYIDFAKLSHYRDVEQRLSEDDVERLQQALDAIKEWRDWK